MLPQCSCNLLSRYIAHSVDNHGGGADHPHIDVSGVVLCYCTERWFTNHPCLRELVRAVVRRKPIIALLEPDTSEQHGGLAEAQIREILQGKKILNGPGGEKSYAERLQRLTGDVNEWSEAWDEPVQLPTAAEVEDALFEFAPIVWSPLTDIQDVSLRMIAERLLPGFQHLYGARYQQIAYKSGEVEQKLNELKGNENKRRKGKTFSTRLGLLGSQASWTFSTRLGLLGSQASWHAKQTSGHFLGALARVPGSACSLAKQHTFHLYCSTRTPRARAIITEIESLMKRWRMPALRWTDNIGLLEDCEHMLVHLNRETWARGAASDAFAREVCQAMRAGVHRLLVHEVPGARLDDESRAGCSFEHVILATPEHLLEAGIYNEIAMNLAGQEWRTAGLAALIRLILKSGGKHKQPKVEPKEPEGWTFDALARDSSTSIEEDEGVARELRASTIDKMGVSIATTAIEIGVNAAATADAQEQAIAEEIGALETRLGELKAQLAAIRGSSEGSSDVINAALCLHATDPRDDFDACSSAQDGSSKLAKQTTRDRKGRKRSVFSDGTTDFIREAPRSARLRLALPAAHGLPRLQTAPSLMLGSVMEALETQQEFDVCSSATDGSGKLAKQTTRERKGRQRSVFADGTTNLTREAPASQRLQLTLPRQQLRPQAALSSRSGSAMAAASLQEGLDTCSSVIDGSGKLAKQTTRERNGRKRSVFADGTTNFTREAPQSARVRLQLPVSRGLPQPQTAPRLSLIREAVTVGVSPIAAAPALPISSAPSLTSGSVLVTASLQQGLDTCSSAQDGSSKLCASSLELTDWGGAPQSTG